MNWLRNRIMGSLEKAFELALSRHSPTMMQHIVLNIVRRWEEARPGDRYGLAVYMQPYLSERFGHPLCGYCQFVVWPEDAPHELCQHELNREMQCPFCDRWIPEGSAYCDYCDGCLDPTQSIFLQFDEEDDDYWDEELEGEPTEVWFTEAPCGHHGYE